MKRAKKHRKRHILPGPAGLRQQGQGHDRDQGNGGGNNSNSSDKENPHNHGDHQHDRNSTGSRRDDDYDDGPDSNSPKKKKRQSLQDDDPAENDDNDSQMMNHEHVQIWDSMCLCLDRILPPPTSSATSRGRRALHNSNNNPIHIIRQALPREYTLLSELSSSNYPLLKIPKIVVQIRTIHSHGHCDYTVELVDESTRIIVMLMMQDHQRRQSTKGRYGNNHGHHDGMTMESGTSGSSSQAVGSRGVAIGWLSQSIIRNHPEWIRPGTVFLCHNVSLAVFKAEEYEDDCDAVDQMLVLNEENIVYAWTKESIDDVKNEQYLRLLERRMDAQERYLAAQEAVDVDFDFDFDDFISHDDEDDDDGGGDGKEENGREDCDELEEQVDADGNVPISVQNQHRLYHHSTTHQNCSKESSNEADWSNIPASSTIDNGTHNVVINEGRVVTQTKTNSSSRHLSSSSSQQNGLNTGNVNATVGSSQSSNRMRNTSGNVNRSNSTTNSRQTTIVTGPNQRMVNSNATSVRVTNRIEQSSQNRMIDVSSVVSSTPASTLKNNPYAKNIISNNRTSVNTTGGSIQSANSTPREKTNMSTSNRKNVVHNPYLRNNRDSLQVSPSPYSQQTVSTVPHENARISGNPYLEKSQSNKNNELQDRPSSATSIKSLSNPSYKQTQTPLLTQPASTNFASVTPTDSTNEQSNGSNIATTVSVTTHRSNDQVVASGQRPNNPYHSSSHSSREQQTQRNPPAGMAAESLEKNTVVVAQNNPSPATTHYPSLSHDFWNSVQSNGMDIEAFDEEPTEPPITAAANNQRKSDELSKLRRTSTNDTIGIQSLVAIPVSMTQNYPTKAPSVVAPSIFSNLDNLEDNEFDAFLEEDD